MLMSDAPFESFDLGRYMDVGDQLRTKPGGFKLGGERGGGDIERRTWMQMRVKARGVSRETHIASRAVKQY